MAVSHLPLPALTVRQAGTLNIITDDALARLTGVRVAFTDSFGGVSKEPYASLNLAGHVGDSADAVRENRCRLMNCLGAGDVPVVVPHQVHGCKLAVISSSDASALDEARRAAASGVDALVVESPDVAALLCFADCVPLVVVSPSGRFAVIHAGWRGVVAGVALKAVEELVALDFADGQSACVGASAYNVYIGPHIGRECFECGQDVRDRFADRFGAECLFGDDKVDLARALSVDLGRIGIDPARIVDAGICTVCQSERFYSYRASGGTCGRHGALAFRRERR